METKLDRKPPPGAAVQNVDTSSDDEREVDHFRPSSVPASPNLGSPTLSASVAEIGLSVDAVTLSQSLKFGFVLHNDLMQARPSSPPR